MTRKYPELTKSVGRKWRYLTGNIPTSLAIAVAGGQERTEIASFDIFFLCLNIPPAKSQPAFFINKAYA